MIILCAVVDVFVDIYMKNVKSSGMKKLDLLKNLLLRTESLKQTKNAKESWSFWHTRVNFVNFVPRLTINEKKWFLQLNF